MDHTADNILTKLWNSYRKEHPKAERPPEYLKEKAKEMESKGKGDAKPAPKPAPKEPEGDKKREEKGRTELGKGGFKSIEDLTSKYDSMHAERSTAMSPEERKSPAGQHHLKKMKALGEAMEAADVFAKAQQKVIESDGDLGDPSVQKKLNKHIDTALSALEKYNAIGDAPPKGMSDTIKGLLSKGKGMADKLRSQLKGKKAGYALRSHHGSRSASDRALVRQMIRLAHTHEDLRPYLLPIIVDHLADD